MARKLNTKFIVLMVGTAGVVGAAYPAARWAQEKMRPSIASLEKKGDEAMKAADYQAAADAYGQAAIREQGNIDLQIKFVDAYEYTVHGDPEKYKQLRIYHANIVKNSPRSVPALTRVLRNQVAIVREVPNDRGQARTLANTASGILTLEPNNREARKAFITATLEPLDANQSIPSEEVDKARGMAEKLWEEDPTDGEPAMMIVRFRQQEIEDAARHGLNDEIAITLDRLQKFVDAAVERSPKDADVQFARFLTYTQLSVRKTGVDPKQREEYSKIAREALTLADEYAKPAEIRRHLNIRLPSLRIAEQTDPKSAEDRYRKLLEEMPDSRLPRLVLAEYLGRQPSRIEDAIAVLEKPWKPTHPLAAMPSMEQRGLAGEEQKRLCVLRLKSIEQLTDKSEKEKRLKQVEQVYNELNVTRSSNQSEGSRIDQSWLNRIEGGLAFHRGRVAEAIDQLDAALKLLAPDSQSGVERQLRNEVLQEYAQAHLSLGQTGKARPALQELIAREPNSAIPHLQLVDVLINEKNYDDAMKEITFLRSRWGASNPIIESKAIRVASLRREVLVGQYQTMAETTRQQRALKVDAASRLNDIDEVIRLTRLMWEADKHDTSAASMLGSSLVRAGQVDEGLRVVKEAQAANPDNEQLKGLYTSLMATTPEQRRELVDDEVERMADPYLRELARARMQAGDGKLDEALATLRKAETINPSDPQALDAQFNILLAQKKFTEAEALLGRLNKLGIDEVAKELKRLTLMSARAEAETAPAKRQAMFVEARERASQVSLKYREIAATSLIYAKLLRQTQQYSDAVEQYILTLDKLPTNLDALRGLIECLLVLNRTNEARQYLDQARKYAPADEKLRELELAYELNYGDPLRAIDALNETLNRNLDNPIAWYQVGWATEQVMRQRAQKGDTNGANQYAQKAAQHWSRAAAKFPTDIRLAGIYADAQRRVGDIAGAEKTIEKLVDQPEWHNKPEAIELLAEQYARSNKLDRAEQLLGDFINKSAPAIPTSSVLKLSALYVQQQRLQDALTVLELKRDDAVVQQQRIQLLVAANELGLARQAIDEALAKNPSPEIDLMAAFIELRMGRFDQADGFLRKVLAKRPDDPAALFYRAQVRLNSVPPDVDAALADLTKLRDSNPANVEARLALSDIYLRRGDRENATREMEGAWASNRSKLVLLRLLDLYTNNSPPQWQSVQVMLAQAKQTEQLAGDPEVILAEANTWVTRGDQRRAIELAKQALAIAPDNNMLQQRYFELLLRAKAYREIIAETEPILQKDRGTIWAYRIRGGAYRRLDQRPEAEREFDAAFNLAMARNDENVFRLVVRTISTELSPKAALERMKRREGGPPSDKLILANLYMADKQNDVAADLLEKLLADKDAAAKLRPDQIEEAQQMQGSAYLQMNPPSLSKALAVYQALLKKHPDDLGLLNNVAYILSTPGSGGTVVEALKYSSRAYELADKMPFNDLTLYVWDTHGWILFKNNKATDGIDVLRRAAEKAQFPEVFLHLAEASMAQNDWEGAENALTSARKILDDWDRTKHPMDANLRPRYQQLAAKLANGKGSPVGMAP